MRSALIAILVLAAAAGVAIAIARPEPIPSSLKPPARSEASQDKATTNEPTEPSDNAEGDSTDEPPHPGYSLTRQDLEQGLLKVRARAMACKDEATPDPLVVKLVISTGGAVTSVQLPQEARGTQAGDCVVRAMKSASFPAWAPTEKVMQVEWSYPLRFDAAD